MSCHVTILVHHTSRHIASHHSTYPSLPFHHSALHNICTAPSHHSLTRHLRDMLRNAMPRRVSGIANQTQLITYCFSAQITISLNSIHHITFFSTIRKCHALIIQMKIKQTTSYHIAQIILFWLHCTHSFQPQQHSVPLHFIIIAKRYWLMLWFQLNYFLPITIIIDCQYCFFIFFRAVNM